MRTKIVYNPEYVMVSNDKVEGKASAQFPVGWDSSVDAFAPGSLAQQLLGLILKRRISLVDADNQPLTDQQIVVMLSRALPSNAMQEGSVSDPGLKPLLDAWSSKIDAYASHNPGKPLSLKSFIQNMLPNPLSGVFAEFKDEPLLKGRIDSDVIDVYLAAMEKNEKKRTEIRDQLASLAAESKIFSIIQSGINAAMANKSGIGVFVPRTEYNLNNKELYGYTTDEQWKGSAQ
jgi:V antigen (LcrV) protein